MLIFLWFSEIVKIACDPSNPPRCALNGGLASYDFDHLLDFYYLYSKQLHKMRRYKSFTNFEALKAFAKNINDIALMSKLKIVEVYKSDVPDIIEKIHNRCNYGPGYADYIFTTTHKAKGKILFKKFPNIYDTMRLHIYNFLVEKIVPMFFWVWGENFQANLIKQSKC